PSAAGVYIGLDSGNTSGGMEICCSQFQYIDFTSPGTDFKGRIIYGYGFNDFQFWISSISTTAARMTLNSTGLNVVGTVTSSSDERLKFNEHR
ncbi:MAG: hypothetical protein ACKPKO_18405, partial [Candidatus Fonsibacter sp.]